MACNGCLGWYSAILMPSPERERGAASSSPDRAKTVPGRQSVLPHLVCTGHTGLKNRFVMVV